MRPDEVRRRQAMHSPLRPLITATVVAVLLTAAVGGISIWRVYDNNRLVSFSYDIKDALDSLLSAITDAETGQRGFLITGDPQYLEPYDRGTARVHAALDHLASLATKDSLRPQDIAELRPLIDQKLQELAETVQARRSEALTPPNASSAPMSGERRWIVSGRS